MEKRKRTETESPRAIPSHLPPDSINPFSRSPGLLLQFSFVGLTDTDEDPADKIPLFPHRGLDHGSSQRGIEPESDGEGEKTDKDEKSTSTPSKGISRRERQFHNLLQATYHFLDQGLIPRAARAYGILLQMQPLGRTVDVRYHNLWAVGAEILMREGEKPPSELSLDDGQTSHRSHHRRWGSAANMGKVRAYLETLIQQHPFDHRRPRTTSAVDFRIALLSCEMYNVSAEHALALEEIDKGLDETEEDLDQSQHWDMDMSESADVESQVEGAFRGSPSTTRDTRSKERRDLVRSKSLRAMKGIASTMDGLLQDRPYSKQDEFLRLRAMVSLYIADLTVPVSPVSRLDAQRAQDEKEKEQAAARAYLSRSRDAGGRLDPISLGIVDADGNSSKEIKRPLFSSLPLRMG